jgi:hypothetical protein
MTRPHVRGREPDRAILQGSGDLHGHRRSGEHHRRGGQAVDEVVGVEARGVDRVPYPRPPHGHEQPGEEQDASERVVVVQAAAQGGHGHHEDQIVEELYPGGVAQLTTFLGGAQARRS